MIHLIVATQLEANPLIKSFDLKKNISEGDFDFFSNDKYSLTITGIGKINSAIGVTHTFFKFKKKNNIWINIGFAGIDKYKIGNLYLVNKVTDNDTKKSLYPIFITDHKIEKKNCITYGLVNKKYNDSLSDMECSGFFSSANRYSTKEIIHSLKIVSDNKKEEIKLSDKELINCIFQKNIPKIKKFILDIEKVWELFFKKETYINNKIDNELQKFKYTFSEAIQMKRLLKIFYYSPYCKKKIINPKKSIKVNIKLLRELLNIT